MKNGTTIVLRIWISCTWIFTFILYKGFTIHFHFHICALCMYMISNNIFFFQCFIIYLQNCTIWNFLMDELGIQNGLLNQNFWKLFWDSNEQNICCNSYMWVKKNYCCLFSLNWCTYIQYLEEFSNLTGNLHY